MNPNLKNFFPTKGILTSTSKPAEVVGKRPREETENFQHKIETKMKIDEKNQKIDNKTHNDHDQKDDEISQSTI